MQLDDLVDEALGTMRPHPPQSMVAAVEARLSRRRRLRLTAGAVAACAACAVLGWRMRPRVEVTTRPATVRREVALVQALPAALPAEVASAMDVATAPWRGPTDARVTLVLFTDYECPFCIRCQATLDQLLLRYPGTLRLVVRQQPLPFHGHAALAAEAALAAHEQGAFWGMHERLMAQPRGLSRAALEHYAGELGLDVARFRAALDDHRFVPAIEHDQRLAGSLGIKGTPTSLIVSRAGTEQINGAQPLDAFVAAVERALAR